MSHAQKKRKSKNTTLHDPEATPPDYKALSLTDEWKDENIIVALAEVLCKTKQFKFQRAVPEYRLVYDIPCVKCHANLPLIESSLSGLWCLGCAKGTLIPERVVTEAATPVDSKK